jgi:hypothetical protein
MNREKAGCQGGGNAKAALPQRKGSLSTMGTIDDNKIPLELPRSEAAAFSQFVKRVDYDTVGRFCAVCVTYSGRSEHDTAWSALRMLQRQLAEAGYDPR